jgi:hypothetical protein
MKSRRFNLFLASLLLIFAVFPTSGAYALEFYESFDGSLNDEFWTWYTTDPAHSGIEDGAFVLTPSAASQAGVLWLRQMISPPFSVEFRFRITHLSGEYGADGFVFMFNKPISSGGIDGYGLGFDSNTGGYGVEFDTYLNYYDSDPTYGHDGPEYGQVALFYRSPTQKWQIMADALQLGMKDGNWHDARIEVDTDFVRVYVDGERKFTYWGYLENGTDDVGNVANHIGFAAGTGDIYEKHWIDEVRVSTAPFVKRVTTTRADAGPGDEVVIQVQFSSPVDVEGEPTLALDDRDGVVDTGVAEYEGGSGTDTLVFRYIVQESDTWMLMDYAHESALSVNGGSIRAANEGLDADLRLPPAGSEDSLFGSILSYLGYQTAVILPDQMYTGDSATLTLHRIYANGYEEILPYSELKMDVGVTDTSVAYFEEYDHKVYALEPGTVEITVYQGNEESSRTITVLPLDMREVVKRVKHQLDANGDGKFDIKDVQEWLRWISPR